MIVEEGLEATREASLGRKVPCLLYEFVLEFSWRDIGVLDSKVNEQLPFHQGTDFAFFEEGLTILLALS